MSAHCSQSPQPSDLLLDKNTSGDAAGRGQSPHLTHPEPHRPRDQTIMSRARNGRTIGSNLQTLTDLVEFLRGQDAVDLAPDQLADVAGDTLAHLALQLFADHLADHVAQHVRIHQLPLRRRCGHSG